MDIILFTILVFHAHNQYLYEIDNYLSPYGYLPRGSIIYNVAGIYKKGNILIRK